MAEMKKSGGFTLIELVVVAGLLGFLSVGLVGVFISSVRGTTNARLQADIKSQGDFAIASIERNLRNAYVLPDSTECLPSDIRYQVKNPDGTFDNRRYRLNSNNIEIDGIANKFLFGNSVRVTALNFTCTPGTGRNPGSIRIIFTISDMNNSLTQSFQTTIALRNIP